MSGTGKINDCVPFGTSLVKELKFCPPQGENVVYPINVPPWEMSKVRISKGPESIIVDEKEEYVRKIEQLEKQKQKVIALIKDGRFVEALKLLEKEK